MTNQLYGHPSLSAADTLRAIAEYAGDTHFFDTYGEGDYLQAFEQTLAQMFGKEAAVFMPSGTMAQQIALRIWCDQHQNPNVAMHPSSHLEQAEQLGYQRLHNLRRLQFGIPEFLESRVLELKDFENLAEKPGAILYELPRRPLGGKLPSWDELVAISNWARARNIPMHMDGARIWQCRPHFQKSFDEIAALFDSVYVSFYKDIGGMFGCVLLGDQTFIDESCVWLRRHGGNLINQGVAVASSKMGMEKILPQIDDWVLKAQELAEIFNSINGARTNPTIPQSSMFQLILEGDADSLNERNKLCEEETGNKLFRSFLPTAFDGLSMTEVHVFEHAMGFDVALIKPFVAQLLKA